MFCKIVYSYHKFFSRKTKSPRYKTKRGSQSAEFTRSNFSYSDHFLYLSKIGSLRIKWSRIFNSNPSSVTVIKRSSGKYFVSLVLNEEKSLMPKTGLSVGVDIGISNVISLSNGECLQNIRTTKKYSNKLAKKQKSMSRKTKGSGRWLKDLLRVARLHEKIKNTREDYLNKLTSNIVKRFDLIAVEDLNVKGMIKNKNLSKHIQDASFGALVKMLDYKCKWYGKTLIKVDRFFPSSKICSSCGYKCEKMPLSMREWLCPSCGVLHDRDINAAKNIINFAAGRVVYARGATVRPSSI